MYAVIQTGGKQEKVSEGQVIAVERLGVAPGGEVAFRPVLLVDGDTVVSRPDELARVEVRGRVVGEVKGPKIRGFTYKPKTNQRRRWGHRQRYDQVEITRITRG
jgi:large subunit ribosomal protein L21